MCLPTPHLETSPCIRLTRGKFELTNQDSGGGKNFTVLTSMQVNRKGIEIRQLFWLEMIISFSLKWIYNSKYHIRLYKAQNWKHCFVSKLLNSNWRQNGSPAVGMAIPL